ncbi:butyrophilin subfamily 1 member A1-like [Anomaloglossus baeobatrachus]|uniref:butyrophilin subfamily 1 member A1-like n=1 Tax=Anomaloglossus baeobatrachus TaxID=238106 RepID=UPI003F4F42C4
MAFLLYAFPVLYLFSAAGSDIPICSSNQTVTAGVGDSAVLSCHFSYGKSTENLTVIWKKRKEGVGAIVVYQNDEAFNNQNADYLNRTAMHEDWLQRNDATLTVTRIRSADAGEYSCWIIESPPSRITEHKCCRRRLYVAQEWKGDRKQLVVSWSIYLSVLSLLILLLFGWSQKRPRSHRLDDV